MANPFHPRSGSAAHVAICRVVELGGAAQFSQLIGQLNPEYQPVAAFQKHVVRELVELGFARVENGTALRATWRGKQYAGRYLPQLLPATRPYVGQVAPGRTHNPARELNVQKHRACAPFRPGSEEYRDIPSLMSGQRVAHKGSSN